jgi:hypothetical protein
MKTGPILCRQRGKPKTGDSGLPTKGERVVIIEPSLYRRRGKPERVWAEIKRQLLRKISARIKSERIALASGEEKSSFGTNDQQIQ